MWKGGFYEGRWSVYETSSPPFSGMGREAAEKCQNRLPEAKMFTSIKTAEPPVEWPTSH